ncbi:MAG: CDP-diacylglycerol--glycerol-3-phosphate 3-phosphatidyltransferase [Chlamydiae bacterium]|nr:CDP-diacylglycerol--glycerol-3-phosphate 3-phosphatidyltransferase [Chlamydiota bacterium]
MNIAHFFTLLRIFISPLFPVLYLEYNWLGIPLVWLPYILLFLLVVCECSDLFDGFLARRRNQVTELGKILDPMADSITHISLFLTFTQGMLQLPLLIVFVFLYRDLFISTLRTLCAFRGVALGARFSGKAKTVMQGVASFVILLLMIPYTIGLLPLEIFRQISLFLISIAALYSVISVGDYIFANRIYIKKALENN